MRSILIALWSVIVLGTALAVPTKHHIDHDPYLWLSDIRGAKALAWVKKQNAKAERTLKNDSFFSETHKAILQSLDTHDRIPLGEVHNNEVFNFWQDEAHVRGILRKTTVAEYRKQDPKWEVLLDVDKLDAETKTDWVFHGANCAPSVKRCLIELSPGGGDASVIREYDPQTHEFLADGFSLALAKSNADYIDDDTIMFGTDFGPGSLTTSGYPRIVKLWHRGEPISNARTIFEGQVSDEDSHAQVYKGPNGETAKTTTAIIVREVSFFQAEYFVVNPDGTTVKLPLPLSANVRGVVNGRVIFTLRDDWPSNGGAEQEGSLMAMPLSQFLHKNAEPEIAEPEFDVLYVPDERSTVEDVVTGGGGVYAAIFTNVIGSVHNFRVGRNGRWNDAKLDIPESGTTKLVSADDWSTEAFFTYESFLTPPTLYEDRGDGKSVAIKSQPPLFDAKEFVAEQFEATSADGTKIPYFVIREKNANEPMPTILYSYGGFELSLFPWYWNDGHRPLDPGQVWLNKGGAIAVANIRGGGEFGPRWHKAALKENRQRAFDDFAATAKDLETRGITTPKQLGLVGASNGGVLTTVTMTQHPELLRAVVCQRPLVDMLRYTHFGAGASWIEEYGDPDKPEDRAYIAKYSAYQNVKVGVKYPSVFFVTETSDDRVTPIWARMMAAKMEAQGHDVLFYESSEGGHGAGATNAQQAEYWALSYAYFARELGLPGAH